MNVLHRLVGIPVEMLYVHKEITFFLYKKWLHLINYYLIYQLTFYETGTKYWPFLTEFDLWSKANDISDKFLINDEVCWGTILSKGWEKWQRE